MDILVSVIIPVYNAERYIGRCLESVNAQTLREIEIICVDDASTDATLSILEEWRRKDQRIRVVHNSENMLESISRNIGLDAATGKYVSFIDADDWIDGDYLETMLSTARQTGFPVVVNANYMLDYENGIKKSAPIGSFGFIKEDVNRYPSFERQNRFPPVVWARLYDRNWLVVNNIRFPQTRWGGGDITFCGLCTMLQKEGYIIKGPWYHYFQHSTSLMRNKEYNFWNVTGFKFLYDEFKARGISKDGLRLFFAGPMVIDSEQKFNTLRDFFSEIKDDVLNRRDLYAPLDVYSLETICSCASYAEFMERFNPNLAASFIRKIR